jgi:hypothetical protein
MRAEDEQIEGHQLSIVLAIERLAGIAPRPARRLSRLALGLADGGGVCGMAKDPARWGKLLYWGQGEWCTILGEGALMKTFSTTIAAVAVVLVAGSAFAQKVTTDNDPKALFSSYETYAWTKGTESTNPLGETRIRDGVDAKTKPLVWRGIATDSAQTQAPPGSGKSEGWKVTVYPILVWVPLGIGINVDLPPIDGGDSGGGGNIIDGRFDGAFLGGLSVSRGPWRIDADGLWAAVGGDRAQNPKLTVDVDVIYVHATGGRKIYKDLYVTAGVRRYALTYDIKLGDRPNFRRKPGVWDPLIGLGWHHAGEKLEVHATFDGGGFGVGADVDIAAALRLDWKPVKHFGLTAGYNVLYLKASDTVVEKTFTFTQTLHGPILGIGFYF